MRKLILILPLILLTSCSPTQCPYNYNAKEPTLQSAEDAMKKEFNEHSFDK